jgi:hypothetical protein
LFYNVGTDIKCLKDLDKLIVMLIFEPFLTTFESRQLSNSKNWLKPKNEVPVWLSLYCPNPLNALCVHQFLRWSNKYFHVQKLIRLFLFDRNGIETKISLSFFVPERILRSFHFLSIWLFLISTWMKKKVTYLVFSLNNIFMLSIS